MQTWRKHGTLCFTPHWLTKECSAFRGQTNLHLKDLSSFRPFFTVHGNSFTLRLVLLLMVAWLPRAIRATANLFQPNRKTGSLAYPLLEEWGGTFLVNISSLLTGQICITCPFLNQSLAKGCNSYDPHRLIGSQAHDWLEWMNGKEATTLLVKEPTVSPPSVGWTRNEWDHACKA